MADELRSGGQFPGISTTSTSTRWSLMVTGWMEALVAVSNSPPPNSKLAFTRRMAGFSPCFLSQWCMPKCQLVPATLRRHPESKMMNFSSSLVTFTGWRRGMEMTTPTDQVGRSLPHGCLQI